MPIRLYVLSKCCLELGTTRREDIAAALKKLALATTVQKVEKACADPDTGPHARNPWVRDKQFGIPSSQTNMSCLSTGGLLNGPRCPRGLCTSLQRLPRLLEDMTHVRVH